LLLKVLCIYNPRAGGGKAQKQLNRIKKLFEKYQINADIQLTKYARHGTKLVQQTDLSKYDALIVAGGDGSFFDVLNAYAKNWLNSNIPIGLIPVGTGNSLSKDISLNINDLDNFVKIIHEKKIKYFDIGKVQTNKEVFYFANMTGFGFTTDVTLTGIKYKYLGDFAYTLGVLLNTVKLKSYPLQMIINGKTYDLNNTYVTISNSKYAGGKMMVAPKASVNDGLLDIVVVNKVSRWKLLKTFPKIFDGTYIHSPFVDYYQSPAVTFTTNHQKIVSPDGEILGQLPIKVSIIPKALPVFVAEALMK